MTPFEMLGKHVVDNVSGLRGVVSNVVEHSSGMVQVGVQPRGNGDNYPDAWNMDPHNISIRRELEPGESSIHVTPIAVTPYEFGTKARTKLSKIVGRIGKRITFLNGCVAYELSCEAGKDNKAETYIVQHNDIEIIEEPKEKPAKSKTGGPASKSPRL